MQKLLTGHLLSQLFLCTIHLIQSSIGILGLFICYTKGYTLNRDITNAPMHELIYQMPTKSEITYIQEKFIKLPCPYPPN